MTQEQLAEALGVTVGAVYKWERDLSTPDIRLILEMADLFDTSTDVLLGYQWKSRGPQALEDRIAALGGQKRFDEAAAEAEKALQKHPNHFGVVYHSAQLYFDMSITRWQDEPAKRSLELFDHACELLAQNTDEGISEVSIRRKMAHLHLWLSNTSEALRILKKHNVCGVNNALIGMILGDYLHDADEAERYLGRAFRVCIEDLNSILVGYANVFFQHGDYRGAMDCIVWLQNALRGIQPEGTFAYFDKYDCALIKSIAELHCFLDEPEAAKNCLREALEKALRYDETPPENHRGTLLFERMHIADQPNYDVYGKTAMECLTRGLSEENYDDDNAPPYIMDLWKEVKKEVLGHEAV